MGASSSQPFLLPGAWIQPTGKHTSESVEYATSFTICRLETTEAIPCGRMVPFRTESIRVLPDRFCSTHGFFARVCIDNRVKHLRAYAVEDDCIELLYPWKTPGIFAYDETPLALFVTLIFPLTTTYAERLAAEADAEDVDVYPDGLMSLYIEHPRDLVGPESQTRCCLHRSLPPHCRDTVFSVFDHRGEQLSKVELRRVTSNDYVLWNFRDEFLMTNGLFVRIIAMPGKKRTSVSPIVPLHPTVVIDDIGFLMECVQDPAIPVKFNRSTLEITNKQDWQFAANESKLIRVPWSISVFPKSTSLVVLHQVNLLNPCEIVSSTLPQSSFPMLLLTPTNQYVTPEYGLNEAKSNVARPYLLPAGSVVAKLELVEKELSNQPLRSVAVQPELDHAQYLFPLSDKQHRMFTVSLEKGLYWVECTPDAQLSRVDRTTIGVKAIPTERVKGDERESDTLTGCIKPGETAVLKVGIVRMEVKGRVGKYQLGLDASMNSRDLVLSTTHYEGGALMTIEVKNIGKVKQLIGEQRVLRIECH